MNLKLFRAALALAAALSPAFAQAQELPQSDLQEYPVAACTADRSTATALFRVEGSLKTPAETKDTLQSLFTRVIGQFKAAEIAGNVPAYLKVLNGEIAAATQSLGDSSTIVTAEPNGFTQDCNLK